MMLLKATIKLNFISPEKVPENTPGAWLTKLSMIAPGLRERGEGTLPLLVLVVLQLAWKNIYIYINIYS